MFFTVSVLALTGDAARAQEAGRPSSGSTKSGVYSEAQAARGDAVYKSQCLECHVPSDYTGDAFTAKFVGGTAFDMFELIRSSMPQNNPGSLSNAQYTDLVAYLFKLNGLPSGEAELPMATDSLKAIKVEARPPQRHQYFRNLNLGVRSPHGSSRIR